MVTKPLLVWERGRSQGMNRVARMVQVCTSDLLKTYLPAVKAFRVAIRRNADFQNHEQE